MADKEKKIKALKPREPHEFACEQRIEFSKKLRDKPTHFELWLWKRLRRGVMGAVVWRQTVIWRYIIDFYIPEFRIAVELDGKKHKPDKDFNRDQYLFHKGVRTLRFPNPKSQADVNSIFSNIYAEVRFQRKKKLPQFSTFAQDSSLSFSLTDFYKGRKEVNPENDEGCAKVEKNPESEPMATACGAVFTTMDIAKRQAAFISRFDGLHEPEMCGKCGKIHVLKKQ